MSSAHNASPPTFDRVSESMIEDVVCAFHLNRCSAELKTGTTRKSEGISNFANCSHTKRKSYARQNQRDSGGKSGANKSNRVHKYRNWYIIRVIRRRSEVLCIIKAYKWSSIVKWWPKRRVQWNNDRVQSAILHWFNELSLPSHIRITKLQSNWVSSVVRLNVANCAVHFYHGGSSASAVGEFDFNGKQSLARQIVWTMKRAGRSANAQNIPWSKQ